MPINAAACGLAAAFTHSCNCWLLLSLCRRPSWLLLEVRSLVAAVALRSCCWLLLSIVAVVTPHSLPVGTVTHRCCCLSLPSCQFCWQPCYCCGWLLLLLVVGWLAVGLLVTDCCLATLAVASNSSCLSQLSLVALVTVFTTPLSSIAFVTRGWDAC